jgi:hypothetical protein
MNREGAKTRRKKRMEDHSAAFRIFFFAPSPLRGSLFLMLERAGWPGNGELRFSGRWKDQRYSITVSPPCP